MELCSDDSLSFSEKVLTIQEALGSCTTSEIVEHLDNAGIIPERFQHDSTEEKLFAKCCDALLASAFGELGLEARVIEQRSDAADVLATGNGYSIVGDAKAFRLSRTAKNQKDFKVESLDQWRHGADFACLVCPWFQYPKRSSQIYLQAIRYNVTLLSYTHLSFMVRNRSSSGVTPVGLKVLWEIGKTLPQGKSASVYWTAIKQAILRLTGESESDWEETVSRDTARLPAQATEQIRYWETEKDRISRLSHDELFGELVEALNIDAKIAVIQKFIN